MVRCLVRESLGPHTALVYIYENDADDCTTLLWAYVIITIKLSLCAFTSKRLATYLQNQTKLFRIS